MVVFVNTAFIYTEHFKTRGWPRSAPFFSPFFVVPSRGAVIPGPRAIL